MNPVVDAFFDPATNTVTYIVSEPEGSRCAIIDPVLDYDPKSGRTSSESADRLVAHVRHSNLKVDWIVETHAHADHLTAARYLKKALGGKIAIGEHIRDVQTIFKEVFNEGADFPTDGSQFDHLIADGETLQIGSLWLQAMHTPGHTPACMTYLVGNAAFVGDTLFMPDYGTARADFPGADPATLYRSIQRLLTLPGDTRLFMCHDYLSAGREDYAWETTVTAQSKNNVHIGHGITESDYVAMRAERDKTLAVPTLLIPAIQVNLRAGKFPAPENNGVCYLKVPINRL